MFRIQKEFRRVVYRKKRKALLRAGSLFAAALALLSFSACGDEREEEPVTRTAGVPAVSDEGREYSSRTAGKPAVYDDEISNSSE